MPVKLDTNCFVSNDPLTVKEVRKYLKFTKDLVPKNVSRHERICKCPKTKTLKMKLNGHKVIKVGTKELIEPIYL